MPWIVDDSRGPGGARPVRGDFPTSTLVEVRALATPKLLVEINAIGFLGGSE
jgi:enamine deaminase RidA (YjgF/YER057c/UK114 family)